MARLTYANGVKVEVADDKAEALLSRGFTAEKSAAKKATAKPSPTSKTSK